MWAVVLRLFCFEIQNNILWDQIDSVVVELVHTFWHLNRGLLHIGEKWASNFPQYKTLCYQTAFPEARIPIQSSWSKFTVSLNVHVAIYSFDCVFCNIYMYSNIYVFIHYISLCSAKMPSEARWWKQKKWRSCVRRRKSGQWQVNDIVLYSLFKISSYILFEYVLQ